MRGPRVILPAFLNRGKGQSVCVCAVGWPFTCAMTTASDSHSAAAAALAVVAVAKWVTLARFARCCPLQASSARTPAGGLVKGKVVGRIAF